MFIRVFTTLSGNRTASFSKETTDVGDAVKSAIAAIEQSGQAKASDIVNIRATVKGAQPNNAVHFGTVRKRTKSTPATPAAGAPATAPAGQPRKR